MTTRYGKPVTAFVVTLRCLLLLAGCIRGDASMATVENKCTVARTAMLGVVHSEMFDASSAADLVLALSTACRMDLASAKLRANISGIVDALAEAAVRADAKENSLHEWRQHRPVLRPSQATAQLPAPMLGTRVQLPGCTDAMRIGSSSMAKRAQSKLLCGAQQALSAAPCYVLSVGSYGEGEFEHKVHELAPTCVVEVWDSTQRGRAFLRNPAGTWAPRFVEENFGRLSWQTFTERNQVASATVLKVECGGSCEQAALLPWLDHICTDHLLLQTDLPSRKPREVIPVLARLSKDYELLYGEDNPLCGQWTGTRCVQLAWRRRVACTRQNWTFPHVTAVNAAQSPHQEPGASSTKSVVIFHTHSANPDWIARAQWARTEVLAQQRGWQAILWKDTQADCQASVAALGASRLAPGCVDDAYIKANMNLFTKKKTSSGRSEWHWLNCDAAWLVYLKREWATFEKYDYFWLAEHDLGWTGSFGNILREFDLAPYDLMCPFLSTSPNAHAGDRVNRSIYGHHIPIPHCQHPILRVSRRLLRVALDELGMKGAGMFCELRLPCACAARKRWCKMFDIHAGFWHHLFAPNIFSSYSHITPLELAQRTTNRSLLYHRVKSCDQLNARGCSRSARNGSTSTDLVSGQRELTQQ